MSKMASDTNYIYKQNYLSGVKPNQTVIIKKQFLDRLPGVKNLEVDPPSESYLRNIPEEWYPYVNSYYPFTEDVDAFARVHHLLASKYPSDSEEKINKQEGVNEYSENRAQRQYLASKPVCFLMLGKPDFGEEELGRRLADYWNCVYIDPLTLVEEEILSSSRSGHCIEFNLRCGRAVGIDVLLRLLAKKLQSSVVLHRGCVCCGFPLIPNDLYEEDPISSESAIFNVREIFEEIIDQSLRAADMSAKVAVSMTGSSSKEEVSDYEDKEEADNEKILPESEIQFSLEWSIENQICGPTDIATDLEKQLNCIFGLFREPFFIIYIYGVNTDVIMKRNNFFYDIYSKKDIDLQKIKLFYEIGGTKDELTADLFDEDKNPFSQNPSLKHIVRLPYNLPANVSTQLDRYHQIIANILDCFVLQHDQEYYIKLDGRKFISELMTQLKQRLEVLPLSPVIIPRKFADTSYEDIGEDAQRVQQQISVAETFLKYSKVNTPSPLFNWVWSDFGSFCPVSMSQGIYQKGSPHLAVHFLNKIYFLADEDSYFKFVENPRPYLLPPFPKPGAKLFVFGPPLSRKSVVSKCLGYLLNSKVLTPNEMHNEYFKQVVDEYTEKVKQKAIAEALELLKQKQISETKEKEESRQKQTAEWEEESMNLLLELYQCFESLGNQSVAMLSSFPIKIEKNGKAEKEQVSIIQQKLVALNFPVIEDSKHCNQLMEDREAFYAHLPHFLQKEASVETLSPLDPFVLNYVNFEVQAIEVDKIKKEVEENIYEMYTRGIRTIEEQSDCDGWIIDGMTTDLSLLKQVCEEFSVYDIIILHASDLNVLVERFKHGTKRPVFHDYRNFLLSIGEKNAAWRAPSITSTQSYKAELATDILSNIIEAGFDEETITNENEISLQKYQNSLQIYEEEIVAVQEFFDKLDIKPVYVEIQDLSTEDLLKEAVNAVQDRYRRRATEFTDADRAEELQQVLAQTNQGVEGEGGNVGIDEFIAQNRRYGDTSFFCPVTFADKFVLWRGKEQFAAKFKDHIYLMANEENLKKFIRFPRKYLLQISPPDRFPPPRICIICPNEDIRNEVGQSLAKNLGVHYLDFFHLKKQHIQALSSMSLFVDQDSYEVPDALIFNFYDVLFPRLWFSEDGFKYDGFVITGFPKKARCLDYLILHDAIPDIIICLRINWETFLNVELERVMEKWRETTEKHRNEENMINSIILGEWEEKRKARYNELIEIKRQNRYTKKMSEDNQEENNTTPKDTNEAGFTSDTQISFDSIIEQQEQDETMKIVDEEFPEPIFETSLESETDVIRKFTAEIENKFNQFNNYYEEMKPICDTELITLLDIDATQELDKVITRCFMIGNELKFRSKSFFEHCYDVSLDVAEKLLENGYYLLSTFGRFCPVQHYEGHNVLQMYLASKEKGNIFPVIHRHYIYFLDGKKNRTKFIKNPLKYTTWKNFRCPLVPIRVAVIGPPKCGKTSLADRFKREFGFTKISRGQAVRYVLSHPLFANLRNILEPTLRTGEELPDEKISQSIEAASFCGDATTTGLVFDGFPNTISEMNFLSRLGLVPHLIFDLQVTEEQIYKQAENPSGKMLIYSKRFIAHVLEEWHKDQHLFRSWCDREYQNVYKLPVDCSIWGVWNHAMEVTLSAAFERKHYYKHIKMDWPLRLGYMLVTPLEYIERKSGYRSYCPGCLFYSRQLINGGDPPDRTGLVHYGKHFYWLCEKHIEDFLKNPDKFLPPSNVTLPLELPTRIHLEEEPTELVEGGYCLVCYRSNFPKKILNKGSLERAVLYRDKVYLFETESCLNSFMAAPEKLCHLSISFKDKDSMNASLNYRDLPVLGMLEQYVVRTVVRAVNHANVCRPVIPGLTVSQAALICVGLNLKIHNTQTAHRSRYEIALQTFHQKRLNLIKYLELMKKYVNPMIHYEEPDSPSSDEDIDEDTRRVPVPDERFDYLCEYYKPVSKVPAFLNVVDIAGLVKGASEGQGLGNAFLSHISACDAIFHLCRVFEDDDVTHVEGDINPVRDLEIIAEELRLKDEETLMKNLEKLERVVCRGGDKKLKPEYDALVKIKGVLVDEKKHIRFGDWDTKDIEVLNKYLFLTSKPTIYLVNLAEKDYIKKKNKWLIKIKEWVDKNDPGALIIPFSGVFENKLAEEYQDPALRKKYLEELNTTSALDKIVVQGYKALQLEYFFTAGPDEVKAWTIQKGTKAPQAAGRIHTDFEKGFIMAEVMKFNDFKEEGSEAACKAAGHYRQQGRNYVVEDGDIIFFKFNAGAGLKDAKKK